MGREAVREALEKRLAEMKENGPFPDVLTFAGNGEPTFTAQHKMPRHDSCSHLIMAYLPPPAKTTVQIHFTARC